MIKCETNYGFQEWLNEHYSLNNQAPITADLQPKNIFE